MAKIIQQLNLGNKSWWMVMYVYWKTCRNPQSKFPQHTLACEEVRCNLGDGVVPEGGWEVACWGTHFVMLQHPFPHPGGAAITIQRVGRYVPESNMKGFVMYYYWWLFLYRFLEFKVLRQDKCLHLLVYLLSQTLCYYYILTWKIKKENTFSES